MSLYFETYHDLIYKRSSISGASATEAASYPVIKSRIPQRTERVAKWALILLQESSGENKLWN
jgi:hypothetical protein